MCVMVVVAIVRVGVAVAQNYKKGEERVWAVVVDAVDMHGQIRSWLETYRCVRKELTWLV